MIYSLIQSKKEVVKLKKLKSKNIAKVGWWEFNKAVRSKMFLFFTFGVPLLMILISGLGFVTEMFGEQQMDIAVIDQTQEFYYRLEDQTDNNSLDFHLHPGTQEEIEEMVEDGEYDGFLIINEENLISGQIPFYVRDVRDVNTNQLRRVLNNAATYYRLEEIGLDEKEVETVTAPVAFMTRTIGETEDEISMAGIFLPMVLGMGLLFSVIFSGQIMMYGVIKEKRNRIVELLLSSVSSLELMMGKIAGYGSLSLLQIIIWFSAGFLIVSRFIDIGDISMTWSELAPPLIFFIFGYILIAALFAAMGATMKEAEEGSQAQGLLILIPMFPLFISGIIFMSPNVLWMRVLSHIPPFIPAMVLLRMAATTLPLWEMVTIFIALLISIIMIIVLGARIFEKGILQYDSISLREIKSMVFKNK